MLSYPALLDLASDKLHPLGFSESFLVGRNETADVCVVDPTCSRHHFRLVLHNGGYHVEPLSPTNPTYLNGRRLVKVAVLEHGAFLQAGALRFQFLLRPANAATAQPAEAAALTGSETIIAPSASGTEHLPGSTVFPLSGMMLIGRERGRAHIHLPHPQVSRSHAVVAVQGAVATLTDLNSANGTFVNGQRIRTTILRKGDQLDIGPYALEFTGTALIPRSRSDNVELVARAVRRIVRNRETGKPMTLLDDIHLVIRPREFVCLLGPSGSGKTTLLKALAGRERADEGTVQLNGRDLYANFQALKQDIAVVPQKDVLHEALAVEQALWYTARLRLPPDTSAAEIKASLEEMLDTVGLRPRRATLIRHLSGGQAKRASLANEILCKPSVLFLDEVTSGLDEQTDREVMNLFRMLADAGKTVVCVTHSLANVDRTCHLVVILTPGGKLAFMGKPAEALEYFGIERLGDVYDRLAAPKVTPEQLRQDPEAQKTLEESTVKKWQEAFLKSPFWQRYVGERLPPESANPAAPVRAPAARPREHLRVLLRQTLLLTSRYAAIWRSDYPALIAMAGQALVVAVLLGVLFGNLETITEEGERAQRSVNLMFLLAISSFWFGCNNAAKEIVKERTIYARERDFNLRVESYYASKLALLVVFSWVQVLLLLAITESWCRPSASVASVLAILLSLAFAGVTIGLGISALAASEEVAITLIPMAVIPQIILSGTVAPLAGWSKTLALAGVSTYWAKRGLDTCLYPHLSEQVRTGMRLEQLSPTVTILVLLAHGAAAILAALAVLHWQSRRRRLGG
jgi:ABC-type multidrug transport system ATPase subunit